MMTEKNSLYTIEKGSFLFPYLSEWPGNFKGEISVGRNGFFKNGLLAYFDADCEILGHIKNKNCITTLSFIVSLEKKDSIDCIYTLSNVTRKYDSIARNFEGHYTGKWYIVQKMPSHPIKPELLGDYSVFEQMINSVIGVAGYVELDLKKKQHSITSFRDVLSSPKHL
jgi:hypothetical protein